jgi:hypothetical protein
VRRFAAEAVSIGTDALVSNGMFLYAALEELRVLRDFSASDWRNHPKFNQNIVRHLFETCLPRAVFKNRKDGTGSQILKINTLMAATAHHQSVLNGLTNGMGELCAKVGLPLAKKVKKGGGREVDKVEVAVLD